MGCKCMEISGHQMHFLISGHGRPHETAEGVRGGQGIRGAGRGHQEGQGWNHQSQGLPPTGLLLLVMHNFQYCICRILKSNNFMFNWTTNLLQVDVIEFTTAIKNEFSFKVGCKEGFGPWMDRVSITLVCGYLSIFLGMYYVVKLE